jgi:radical SAM superfamily enzyme YgiQ (UPF0313 family)
MINEIKYHKDCRIVVGGPHVSATKAHVLEHTAADFAVKGEGELTLLELCHALNEGDSDYSNIQGLLWRTDNRIVENEDRPLINELDELPFPAYELFELKKYLCYIDKQMPIITSRGCPYRCVFCAVILSFGRKFRARSPENIISEIKYWYNKGWNNFEFQDDNFTFDKDRTTRICQLIIDNSIKIKWSLSTGIRADKVDEELLKKMKEAGCTRVSFGIESANNEVLKNIKKSIKIEVIEAAIKMVKKVGIDSVGCFIIGLPGESYQSFLKSLEFAQKMPLSQVNFYNLMPFPGTELIDWIEKNGTFLIPQEEYLNNITTWDNQPIFETKDFSKSERKKAFKQGYSLHRKSIAQLKLGKFLGYIAWILAFHPALEKLFLEIFKTNPVGRRIYKFVSSITEGKKRGVKK